MVKRGGVTASRSGKRRANIDPDGDAWTSRRDRRGGAAMCPAFAGREPDRRSLVRVRCSDRTAGEELMEYDPLAASTLEDPFQAYADLRARCPVHHHAGFNPPFFTLSRHDDVLDGLRDHQLWSM